MPTSCNTHDYDGKLREKWFEIRPMLLETYLPKCLSFERTLNELEQWLNRKYPQAKRIDRARRSMKILASQRKSNFDACNEIDVEELLPILWDKVKSQDDIHDTFYEQLCDITGGSCSQGRSTRLFQFLFLFDFPSPSPSSSSSSSSATTDTNTATATNLENEKENRSDDHDTSKIDTVSSTTLDQHPVVPPETTSSADPLPMSPPAPLIPTETIVSDEQLSEPEQTQPSPPLVE